MRIAGRKQVFNTPETFKNLYQAFRKARRGGKRKKDSVVTFELDLEANLWRLHEELCAQTHRPAPYHNFTVQEREPRLVSATPFNIRRKRSGSFRDRVVHHVLCNVVQPVFERRFEVLEPLTALRDIDGTEGRRLSGAGGVSVVQCPR